MRHLIALLLLALAVACGGGSSSQNGGGPSNPPPPKPAAVPTGVFRKPAAAPLAPGVVTLQDPLMIVHQVDATQSDFHVVFPSLGQTYGRVSYLSDGTLAFTGTDSISRPGGTLGVWFMRGTWSGSTMTVETPEGTFTFTNQGAEPQTAYVGTYTCTDTSSGLPTTLTFSNAADFRIQDQDRDVAGRLTTLDGAGAIYKLQAYSDNTQYHSQFGMACLDSQGRLTVLLANTVDAKAGAFFGVFTKNP